jgi:uncharacterized protein YceK
MRRRVASSLAAVLIVALGGCGTAVNFASVEDLGAPKRVYGGVTQDTHWASHFFSEAFEGPPVEGATWCNKLLAGSFALGCGICALAVDLPLSAAADTLTLPITIPATVMRWHRAIFWADHETEMQSLARQLATPPTPAGTEPDANAKPPEQSQKPE